MAPRAPAIRCNTCSQPDAPSSARSIASTWPRIRRTRASSFCFSRIVCVMREQYHSPPPYTRSDQGALWTSAASALESLSGGALNALLVDLRRCVLAARELDGRDRHQHLGARFEILGFEQRLLLPRTARAHHRQAVDQSFV